MRQRNDGQGEVNSVQNQFTAYLTVAIQRRKRDYMDKKNRLLAHEISDSLQRMDIPDPNALEPLEYFPVLMSLENLMLLEAIESLDELERSILFARVLEKCDYGELAKKLGLHYKGVSAAYYRVLQKLRRKLGGDKQ